MKSLGKMKTGVLLLLLGAAAPAFAQQDRGEEKARHPQDQQRPQREKQQPRPEQPQPRPMRQAQPSHAEGQPGRQPASPRERPMQPRPQPARVQQEQQRQRQAKPVPQREQHGVWQQRRARNWRSEHRTWDQRGSYTGYRIPENRYRGHFGPSRVFRLRSYPLIVFGGYPRFQFGGFWFSVLDPWPEYWSDNWYDSDDVYIDYAGDGYYLYNRRHPLDRIAISVSVQLN